MCEGGKKYKLFKFRYIWFIKGKYSNIVFYYDKKCKVINCYIISIIFFLIDLSVVILYFNFFVFCIYMYYK